MKLRELLNLYLKEIQNKDKKFYLLLNQIKFGRKTRKLEVKIEKTCSEYAEKINIFRLMYITNNLKDFYNLANTEWINLKKIILNKNVLYKNIVHCYDDSQWICFLFMALLSCLRHNKYTKTNLIGTLYKIIREDLIRNEYVKSTYDILPIAKLSMQLIEILFSIKMLDYEFTTHEFKLADKAVNDLKTKISIHEAILPMVIPPINWKKYNDIYLGGFIIRKYKFILEKNKNSIINLNDSFLANINFLQSIPLYINKKRLNYLINQSINCISKEFKYHLAKGFLGELPGKLKLSYMVDSRVFLLSLVIADSFKNKAMYFPIACDWRGRTGYPLQNPFHFFSRKLIKKLFKFKEGNLIELDATAQSMQIYSALCYDYNILYLTNVINSTNRKNDIYNEISKFFEKKSNIFIDKYKKLYEEDSNKSFFKKIKISPNIFQEEFLKIFKNRKFIKSLIMTYFYNETTHGRFTKIINFINLEYSDIIWKVCSNFAQEFNSILTEYSPKITTLVKIITKIAEIKTKENECIIFYLNKNYHSVQQNYFKPLKIKPKGKSWLNGDIMHATLVIPYEKIEKHEKKTKRSLAKTKQSTPANFIQYLDSCILQSLVKKCREKCIPIVTQHDCFYTIEKYKNILIEFYQEAFYEITVQCEPLKKFIEKNLEDEKYTKYREKYLKKIENMKNFNLTLEEIKKSKFILC